MPIQHAYSILSVLIITCLSILTLTGCDDATAPEAADTLPESAAKTYDPNALDFFQEHGEAALIEAQEQLEQEFPGAKAYGLTFAVDDGSEFLTSGWCGSDGDPPIWPEEFRNHMEGWIQQEGGPEGYTVKALAALPPGTTFDEAGGLQVEEINPEEFPYVRVSASGDVEPLQNQPLPDPFSKVSITPLPDPFVNVFTPVEVEEGILPLEKSWTYEATASVAGVSPQLREEITSVISDDVVIGEIELDIDRKIYEFRPRICYVADPPPDWCWDRVDPCTLSPYPCNIKDLDLWSKRVPIDPDGPSVFMNPRDVFTLDASALSEVQLEVALQGDRILRPTGTVVESVLMTPDFEGADVPRPY